MDPDAWLVLLGSAENKVNMAAVHLGMMGVAETKVNTPQTIRVDSLDSKHCHTWWHNYMENTFPLVTSGFSSQRASNVELIINYIGRHISQYFVMLLISITKMHLKVIFLEWRFSKKWPMSKLSGQTPIPLTKFRLNLKFNENL